MSLGSTSTTATDSHASNHATRRDTPMMGDSEAILLRPRPLAKFAGSFLLLPLLPKRMPMKPLPAEVWTQILEYVFNEYDTKVVDGTSEERDVVRERKLGLLLVCKSLKDVALPLFYNYVRITRPFSLQEFTELLQASDQRWDSIRRIPYSAPGRWVHTLDLSSLSTTLWSDSLLIDSLLTKLFPLVPFLTDLTLNATVTLSRRAIESLAFRDGQQKLRRLKGIKLASAPLDEYQPFLEVLRYSRSLEELSIVGSGIEAIQMASSNPSIPLEDASTLVQPLDLPLLRKLSIISMHTSQTMFALLHSSLPSLAYLTITPYDDISIPTSLVPQFITTHGPKLISLHLYAHKSWPTMLFPSPTTLLHTCPSLHHLSLENPLPTLSICSIYPKHPLRILSIPRPNANYLSVLETLLPKLPCLGMVRARDVRWLRKGVSGRALEAGIQGEMREWRRRLGRRGIQVVDADWNAGVD